MLASFANKPAVPIRTVRLLIVVLCSVTVAAAATVPRLIDRLKDENARGQDHWIYNDLQKALTEARRTGKPIFVTFRCVPCEACKSFDAEVANGSHVIRDLAQTRFVSLRQVEMKGVDLGLFQFDYDLNWAAMFINADGVVYGRYGTQSVAGPDAYNDIESLKKAMNRVLALHEKYPDNKRELAAKRGEPKPYRTALDMPGLENKTKFRQITERNNCIHCHNIHDAENLQLFRLGQLTKDKLWRYPLPENVGLVIDPKDGRRIARVLPDSPAARAGINAGQIITHVNGQPIISIADIQWVLHNLPNTVTILRIRLAGARGEHVLYTPAGWKWTDISWRGSLWGIPPRLRVWSAEAKGGELARLKLPAGYGAMKVRWINVDTPEGRAAYSAGLREGDYIVAVNGRSINMNNKQFNLYVKMNYRPGDKLPVTLLRNGRFLEFMWPLK